MRDIGSNRARRHAINAVPCPVPPEGVEFEDSGPVDRDLPKDEPPPGIEPEKWRLMSRGQRRAARRS